MRRTMGANHNSEPLTFTLEPSRRFHSNLCCHPLRGERTTAVNNRLDQNASASATPSVAMDILRSASDSRCDNLSLTNPLNHQFQCNPHCGRLIRHSFSALIGELYAFTFNQSSSRWRALRGSRIGGRVAAPPFVRLVGSELMRRTQGQRREPAADDVRFVSEESAGSRRSPSRLFMTSRSPRVSKGPLLRFCFLSPQSFFVHSRDVVSKYRLIRVPRYSPSKDVNFRSGL